MRVFASGSRLVLHRICLSVNKTANANTADGLSLGTGAKLRNRAAHLDPDRCSVLRRTMQTRRGVPKPLRAGGRDVCSCLDHSRRILLGQRPSYNSMQGGEQEKVNNKGTSGIYCWSVTAVYFLTLMGTLNFFVLLFLTVKFLLFSLFRSILTL